MEGTVRQGLRFIVLIREDLKVEPFANVIRHFRITVSLFFKASPGAHSFI